MKHFSLAIACAVSSAQASYVPVQTVEAPTVFGCFDGRYETSHAQLKFCIDRYPSQFDENGSRDVPNCFARFWPPEAISYCRDFTEYMLRPTREECFDTTAAGFAGFSDDQQALCAKEFPLDFTVDGFVRTCGFTRNDFLFPDPEDPIWKLDPSLRPEFVDNGLFDVTGRAPLSVPQTAFCIEQSARARAEAQKEAEEAHIDWCHSIVLNLPSSARETIGFEATWPEWVSGAQRRLCVDEYPESFSLRGLLPTCPRGDDSPLCKVIAELRPNPTPNTRRPLRS